MKKVSFLLLLFISFHSFAQKIPFVLLPSGHILVQATVEGKTGNFIFDTGGGLNLFFNDYASSLPPKKTYNFLTAFRATGERIDAPLYHSNEIDFVGKKFKNVPYATYNMTIPNINGLIALQMFENTDVVIDYINKEITLTTIDPIKNKKSIDIQLSTLADNSTDIFTYVYLNKEIKIKVLLDSGAGSNSFWFSNQLINTLAIDPSKLALVERKSEFDAQVVTKFYNGKIQSISNEYAAVDNPTVTFVEGLIYEGKTSINWLGNKIGISLKQKKIFILD